MCALVVSGEPKDIIDFINNYKTTIMIGREMDTNNTFAIILTFSWAYFTEPTSFRISCIYKLYRRERQLIWKLKPTSYPFILLPPLDICSLPEFIKDFTCRIYRHSLVIFWWVRQLLLGSCQILGRFKNCSDEFNRFVLLC